MTAPTTPCAECGMPCTPGEFHPYAACLMFKACHDSETVRANLAALAAPAAPAEPPKPVEGWHLETGTGGFSEKGDRWVCVRNLRTQCGQDFYEDRDPLMFAFLTALASPTVTIDGPEAARGDGGEG